MDFNEESIVPKVKWQFVASLIAGLVVAGLVRLGVELGVAEQIGAQSIPFLADVLPVIAGALIGLLVGYMKTDPQKDFLFTILPILDKIVQDGGQHDIRAYVDAIRRQK